MVGYPPQGMGPRVFLGPGGAATDGAAPTVVGIRKVGVLLARGG